MEDVSFRRVLEPLSVDAVLLAVSEGLGVKVDALRERRRNSPLRGIAARMLIRYGGQSQRQAAAHLRLGTGGAVSVLVRRLPALLDADPRLLRRVKTIEERLQAARGGGGGGRRDAVGQRVGQGSTASGAGKEG